MESTLKRGNINTLSGKSELFITILASVAQGESENISSNNRWAIQKRFQDGTYIISTPAYGYGKDEDGNLVIIESEAETVRWIYESSLKRHGSVCDSKGTEPERHSDDPGCRKVAGRGDTGHSENPIL